MPKQHPLIREFLWHPISMDTADYLVADQYANFNPKIFEGRDVFCPSWSRDTVRSLIYPAPATHNQLTTFERNQNKSKLEVVSYHSIMSGHCLGIIVHHI